MSKRTNNQNSAVANISPSDEKLVSETPGHFSLVRESLRAERQSDWYEHVALSVIEYIHGGNAKFSLPIAPRLLFSNFHLADIITLLNGVCGSLSVFSSMRYLLTADIADLWLAIYFIPLGFTFDVLDGRVARWRKKSSQLGQELDSLADLVSGLMGGQSVWVRVCGYECVGTSVWVRLCGYECGRASNAECLYEREGKLSFGMAPAALAFAAGLRTYLDTLVLTYFIACGIARLARYNATVALLPKDASGKVAYFEGTPIPTSLSLVALIAYNIAEKSFGTDAIPGGVVSLAKLAWGGDGWDAHPFVALFALSGTLMVSKTLKIPKP
ncbi:hypothetical protein BC936DRAFT_147700 [Jimgerdemannia flammicorona]|uniref:CDP-alcohol phosphatidyltransferase-domain-containing protein n=1 Tax=Jimgerdemannia flammicorona TaxID=994334 RepID=A0A433D4R0_9FUNG|nr:hypothetical protein BC936DRAFT_147700 [Jimgerdemannia flammicorona]